MRNYLYHSFISLAIIASCNSQSGTGNGANTENTTQATELPASEEQVSAPEVYTAPDLRLPNVDGDTIALSSLKGNIVLIDFWASWCGPCRRENPRVVSMYNRVKDKKLKGGGKFIIYSVSLDDNKLAWVTAIKQDKLDWPYHVSDLRGWNSVAASMYRVEGIPTNFLLDATGAIVARDRSMPEIELYLKDQFAEN